MSDPADKKDPRTHSEGEPAEVPFDPDGKTFIDRDSKTLYQPDEDEDAAATMLEGDLDMPSEQPPGQDDIRTMQAPPGYDGGPQQFGGSPAPEDQVLTIQQETPLPVGASRDTQAETVPPSDPDYEDASKVGSKPSSGVLRSGGSSRGRLKSSTKGGTMASGRLVEGEVYAGKYELMHEIARGGMGVVYKARQIDLNRIVALKVMLSGSHASESERRRFILEAEASARLKHPNIVPVYDIGEVGENLYFTMDYVEGEPLSKRKKELSREQLHEVMIKVCDGVAYAHQRGIIHRDLKPGNVMMTADNNPLIMDFGLAKQVEVVDEEGQPSLKTREGSVMGTPHYMPPEQAEGMISEIDVRSDVYALGVILYELWCGKLPFTARSISELMLKIFEEDPTPPRQLDSTIDIDMEAIILKAIEKPKAKRYDSAGDLREDLERQRDGLTISARRATPFYRAQKYIWRNRAKLAVTSVILMLVAGFIGFAVYVRIAEQRRAEDQFQARMLAAKSGMTELGQEWKKVQDALDAFLASKQTKVEARGTAAPVHAGKVTELQTRLADLRATLKEYSARQSAQRMDGDLEKMAGIMSTHAGRLTTLASVHDHLKQAEAQLAAADGLCGKAIEALSGKAEKISAQAPRELVPAMDYYEKRLKEGAGAALFGEGFQTAKKSLDDALEKVSQHVFTALSDSIAGSPERTRARDYLGRVAGVRARLEKARSGASGVRLALRMVDASGDLLGLLGKSRQAKGKEEDHLRGARLAQSLVQRGLEGDPSQKQLTSLRFAANRAYAEVLLAVNAYRIFQAELASKGAFSDKDRSELLKKLELALEGKRALSDLLDRRLSGLGQLGVDRLEERIAELEALKSHPAAADTALAARRKQGLSEARRALKERATSDVTTALGKARKAEGLTPQEQARQLTRLLGIWTEAEELANKRKKHLGKKLLAAARGAIRLGRATLYRNAALGLEQSEPARALELARQAEQVGGKNQATRELVRRLSRTLARLKRKEETPEGMILVPGSKHVVELGEGGERNPHRKLRVEPFYLAVREVTNNEYLKFVGSPQFASKAFWKGIGVRVEDVKPPSGWVGRRPPKGQGAFPVAGLTWHEARGYARFMKRRLPTDAEWEYAARYLGETARAFPWGDAWDAAKLRRVLQAPGANQDDKTPSGVFDMAGNVSEWVALQGDRAAARGASFLYPFQRIATGTFRLLPDPGYRGPQLGLRLAKDSLQ